MSPRREKMAEEEFDEQHENNNGEVEPDPEVVEILEDQEMAKADKIRALYGKGYTRAQIVNDFGFSDATVYKVMPAKKKREGFSSNNKSDPFDSHPVLHRVSGGGEAVNPEVILRKLSNGSEDGQLRLDGMLELRASILLAQELAQVKQTEAKTQEMQANALVKLMREAREESKQSNEDLAKQTVTQVANVLEDIVNRPRPSEQPREEKPKDTGNELQTRINKYLGSMFDMMEGMFMPGQGPSGQLEGWEYEDRTGAPASGGSPTSGAGEGQPEQQPGGPPPGWETETRKEESDGNESGDVRNESGADGPGAGGGQAPEDGGQEIPDDREG